MEGFEVDTRGWVKPGGTVAVEIYVRDRKDGPSRRIILEVPLEDMRVWRGFEHVETLQVAKVK